MNRKLGKPTDQRMAMIKNQASELLWFGRIETTYPRAKSVQRYVEKLITKAINTYEDTVTVTKTVTVLETKGKETKEVKKDKEFINDGPKKLAARRAIMAKLVDLKEIKQPGESKGEYFDRTHEVNHPLIEKLFNEIAPKYAERAKEKGQGGGYTRVLKLGVRRGDAAEMAIIELI